MDFGSRRKNAWVTYAVDEKSSAEAICLAKTLFYTLTQAEVIVLTSYDVFNSNIGKHLIRHFDVVIPHQIDSTNTDILKFTACNLQMYSKCVILSPNKMTTKNCDELFEMDHFLAIAFDQHENVFDSSVFVISPRFYLQSGLAQMAHNNGLYDMSSIFNAFLKLKRNEGTYQQLSSKYNYKIIDALPNLRDLHSGKIVDFGNVDALKKQNTTNMLTQKALDDLLSYHNAIYNSNNFGSAFTLEKYNWELSMESEKRHYYRNAIAIVGHSCRFPGANSSNEFWEFLKIGGDGISPIPPDRLLAFQANDPRYKASRGGFLKCPIDEFDARFFGISPRETTFMDPQQRLLLEIAWEALEHAAINPLSLKGGNTGVFTGVWQHDYERLVLENASAEDFHHVILGNAFSATSARVSYFLGLNGPNISIESGCSSSMVSLHLACDSLRKRETDLSLVLGVNILAVNLPYSVIPVLSSDGHCKTYDEKADGIGRAEGVAGIVLKRLPDALQNGDRILGIVRGTALSNEGTSGNFGTPSKLCQEIAVKDAIRNAGVEPRDVDYVEAHGTGTPVGDPIEFAALSAGYAKGKRDKPLFVGSVKTNTGHTESAAGLAGLLKVLLSMQHETIPPHINFTTINPNIDLNAIPAMIPVQCEEWSKNPERRRIAGVSSFGISGTNVHAIIEEPPTFLQNNDLRERNAFRSHQILTISAKSENALNDLTKKYVEYFDSTPNVDIQDLTFTANTGRAHFKYRSAYIGENIKELQTSIRSDAYSSPVLQSVKPNIAFLFTGQGSQYFGMGKEFYYSNVAFQNAFDDCESYLQEKYNLSIKNALWEDPSSILLEQTVNSQLSIFSLEYSLWKLWDSLGIKADFVLGHSVGEYAAAVADGALVYQDALDLIVERCRLVDTLPEGRMLAVKTSRETVENLILEFSSTDSNFWVDIAGVNSPHETVVAGDKSTMVAFEEFCSRKGNQTQLLAANCAFHSRAVDAISDQFINYCQKIPFKGFSFKYISGMRGETISDGNVDSLYWVDHMRNTVNFEAGVKTLFENGCNTFIEIGSHPILLALGMSNSSFTNISVWLPSLRRKETCWKTFLESLGKIYMNGVNVNWNNLHVAECHKKIELPTYPFQRQKYWVDCESDKFAMKAHPLLGREISLSKPDVKVFENIFNLKEFPYFKDHKVANLILLPGATYLEIILAFAKRFFNQLHGINVTDFSIEAPFELEIEKKYCMQTSASILKENEPVRVEVHVFQNSSGYDDEKCWKLYASANISLRKDSCEILDEKKDNVDAIKLRCSDDYKGQLYYDKALQLGVHLGGSFQSLDTLWNGNGEVLAEIPSMLKDSDLSDGYIYHTLILDALFQLFSIRMDYEGKDMYLPIAFDKVTIVAQHLESKMFYAHFIYNDESKARILLYNENSDLLLILERLRFVKTSNNTLLNIINSQKRSLPGMYHEIWRSRDGPLQSRVDLPFEIICKNLQEELDVTLKEETIEYHDFHPLHKDEFWTALIVQCLLELNWEPKVGESVNLDSFLTSRGYSHATEGIIRRFFEILCEDGYLASDGDDEWRIAKLLPTSEEVESTCQIFDELVDQIQKKRNKIHAITKMAKHCLQQLPRVCDGEVLPHSLLFENEDPSLNVLKGFATANEIGYSNKCMAVYLQSVFKQLSSKGKNSGSVLRIIEIGGGSGATTIEIINGLKESGIRYRYTFTDISPIIVNEAKTKYTDVDYLDYAVLDIEKDPLTQGVAPFHYDVVVASNVIHATENLHKSVRNARVLLRDGGILLLQEMLGPKRPVDVIYGILSNYWKFSDFETRRTHPCVEKNIWDKVLMESGFNISEEISMSISLCAVLATSTNNLLTIPITKELQQNQEDKAWILFCDTDEDGTYATLKEMLESIGRKVLLIKCTNDFKNQNKNVEPDCFYINSMVDTEVESCLDEIFNCTTVEGMCYLRSISDYAWDNQSKICIPALNCIKYFIAKNQVNFRFYVVTSGVYSIGNQKNLTPHKATLVGMLKSAANEMSNLKFKLVELDPDCTDSNQNTRELFSELFTGEDIICCFRKKMKYVMRICPMSKPSASLPLPKGRYTILKPTSKKIEDVQFCITSKPVLEPYYIEVEVKATALNFRDLFVILQPSEFQSKYDSVGSDFSGIVTAVGPLVTNHRIGDAVFGISVNSCAASHVAAHESLVMPIPKGYTFSEACTLPSVFLTVSLCLVTEANLQKAETVLIHVASGGVGLVAIQIARHLGAHIIATAGSSRKRKYLRSIGIEHVFHSRDLSFKTEITKVTNGKGVDVVLNSLTGPGFKEASLNVCGIGARFIEMGKVNVWSEEDVQLLRPDVKYTLFDLEKVERSTLEKACSSLREYTDSGLPPFMPYMKFSICQIKDALHYFAKAEHIGKIVLETPEVREVNGRQLLSDYNFNGSSTYLITGGISGIGLEVLRWMINCGAKNVVLVARSKANDTIQQILSQLRGNGCRIEHMQIDIGDWEQCSGLFQNLQSPKNNWPPLKGIIHSAGVISDGTLSNQTWEKFETVFNAKVSGGWNLHNLSKNLCLEHFIVFSSFAAIVGSMGQSNYTAANMFLDALVHYRHSLGLPAQTINWGVWAKVGAAAKHSEFNDGKFGIRSFSPAQGIAALKFIMSRPYLNQVSVVQLDAVALIETFGTGGNLLSELSIEINDEDSAAQSAATSEAFWADISPLDLQERVNYIKKIFVKTIKKTLRLPDSELVDEFQTFSDMGLDSLMAVEIKIKLQNYVGKKLTLNATSLLDHPTVNSLSNYLAEQTMTVTEVSQISESPSDDKVEFEVDINLLKADSLLPEDIQCVNTGICVQPSEIESILLTGSTGTFGIYVLKDLLKNPSLNIYCLIRGKSSAQGRKKLAAVVKKYGLVKDIDIDRVVVLIGDVVDPQLGLSKESYDKLATEIDCVIHLAIRANYNDVYQNSKSSVGDIRSVNVLGTINILKFSSVVRTKRVFYSSTYSTINTLTDEGFINENFPDDENYGDNINMGYPLSKFVCEKLLKQANDRGIPCTNVRYLELTGDSQTGIFAVEKNSFVNFILMCIQYNAIVDIEGGWCFMPVDVASQLTVELLFNDDAETGVYNFMPPNPMYTQDLVNALSQLGYNLSVVSFDKFHDIVLKRDQSEWGSMVIDSKGSNIKDRLLKATTAISLLKDKRRVFRISNKLLKAIPDFHDKLFDSKTALDNYLKYAKTKGMLKDVEIPILEPIG